jgi:pilus assembly protein Flp/PilA
MLGVIGKFLKDAKGATAIEYGVVAALVAVTIVGALTAVGTGLISLFATGNTGF